MDDNFFEPIAQAIQTNTKSIQTAIRSKTANCKEYFSSERSRQGICLLILMFSGSLTFVVFYIFDRK